MTIQYTEASVVHEEKFADLKLAEQLFRERVRLGEMPTYRDDTGERVQMLGFDTSVEVVVFTSPFVAG